MTLDRIEAYYDAAPRPLAVTEDVGPFTLFVRKAPGGWPYYARPRLGGTGDITADDVRAVLARQRELGVPQAVEWVHETTPSLLAAARSAGLTVHENPLLVLPEGAGPTHVEHAPGHRTEVLAADSPDLGAVVAAIGAGFGGTDDVAPAGEGDRAAQVEAGLLILVAAYDGHGTVVGGGSHNPRHGATELAGIAVLPRARRQGVGAAITQALVDDARARGIATVLLSAQDDAVARVYERVGFVRVGLACVAEA